MPSWYKFVVDYFWIASHALLVFVAVLMYRRGLHKKFPLFCTYTLYEFLSFLVLFSFHTFGGGYGRSYLYLFIVTMAGSTALRFGVIQEIFNNVFQHYPRLQTIATISMRWTMGILVIAAIVTAIYSTASVPNQLLAGVALLDRSVTIIQAGMLLFLFLFSHMFGLSWRSYTFGIALGFAIIASSELAGSAIRLTNLTPRSADLLDLLVTGTYHFSVLIWVGYLLAAEKAVSARAYPVHEIDRWSGELERSQ